MTVHAAKGLEFDHVFVLRLTQRRLSDAGSGPRVLEFPEALMKEELPKSAISTSRRSGAFFTWR